MDTRILCVRHGDGPMDDRITTWCGANQIRCDARRPWRGETLGEITDDLQGVVIYGGRYNAYDTDLHPFLNEEYRIIDAAMQANVPLLGICQGAQMIAHHLGAWAGAPAHGQHEFGWYEITPTDDAGDVFDAPIHVAQSHYHSYDLPSGARHLARSPAFEQQAFALGDRVLGVQFHPEQTVAGFMRWQARADDWRLLDAPGLQDRAMQTHLMLQHDAALGAWMRGFLDTFFGATRP